MLKQLLEGINSRDIDEGKLIPKVSWHLVPYAQHMQSHYYAPCVEAESIGILGK